MTPAPRRRRKALKLGTLAGVAAVITSLVVWVTQHKDTACAVAVALCAAPPISPVSLPPPSGDQLRPGPDGKCRQGVPRDGGCWATVNVSPPCPTRTHEAEGRCWMAILAPAGKFPASVHPPLSRP